MENYFCANSVEEQVDYLTDKVKDIITNKLDKASIVQETGTGTDVVMSQKAVTDAIENKGLDTLTNVDLTLGNTTVQYDTTNGIQLNSVARFTDAAGNHDATMELSLPVVGKDGIVIEKAADSEKIEVSGKNFRKALETEVGQWKIYASREGNPNDYFWTGKEVLEDSTIVVRGNNGCIYTNMPDAANTKDTTVPNKKYVDDHFTPAYSSSPPVLWGGQLICYNNNKYGRCALDPGTAQYTAVLRDTGGQINLPEIPAKDYNAVCKKYGDDAIASISPTTQTKYQHNLVLEGTKLGDTIKAFMSIPRSDDTTFGTLNEVIAALGDAYIPCTGYIYDGNQKSYNIIAFNTAGPGFEYNNPETGGQVYLIANDDVTVTDNKLAF